MDTTRIKIEDVKRGSLARNRDGRTVVLDTLSGDERGPYWVDTNGGRHRADSNGALVVYVATVRTDAVGESAGKSGASHALTFAGTPLCPNGRRSGTLEVWESGTAVAGITCRACRKALNLAPRRERESAGI